mgnify:CR=1 FL=1
MTMDNAVPGPAWLRESCPSWCTGDHHRQVLAADRGHFGELCEVPAITRRYRHASDCDPVPIVDAGALVLAASRGIGARDTWVAIGTEHERIEVTLESALRLLDQLAVFLNGLNPATDR